MRTHSKNQNKGRGFVFGLTCLALAMGSAGCGGGPSDPVSPYEIDFLTPASFQSVKLEVKYNVVAVKDDQLPGNWVCQRERRADTTGTPVTACYFHPAEGVTFPIDQRTVFQVAFTASGPKPCMLLSMMGQTCEGNLPPSEYPQVWPNTSYAQGSAGIRINQAFYNRRSAIIDGDGHSFLTIDWSADQDLSAPPAAPTP